MGRIFTSTTILLFALGCTTLSQNNQSGLQRAVAATAETFETSSAASPAQIVEFLIQRIGPARNQRNTQLCFGHAVADVVTFHSGQRVSAFSVAIRNFQSRRGLDYLFFNPGGVIASQVSPNSRYMLGLASSTLESSLNHSLCPDDQPASDLLYNDQSLKRLWNTYHREFRTYIGPQAPTHLFSKISDLLSPISPSLPALNFIQHLNRYQTLDDALGKWFDRNCHISISQSKNFKVVGRETQRLPPNQIVSALNKALDAQQPAVIHYDPGVLDAENPSVFQSVIGFHVSTIFARAEWNGAKYYLLRNSWGTDCSIYSNDIERRCDRGHIWLTEQEIRRYVTSVAYLEVN